MSIVSAILATCSARRIDAALTLSARVRCTWKKFRDTLLKVQNVVYEDGGPSLHGMHYKLLVVRVRFMGLEGRAGVKDGKDGDEDDQVDVWCFPERKTEMRMIRWMCGVSLKERQR